MRRVVADTGPLLHLWEARALELLVSLGEVSIPPAVLREFRLHAPGVWTEGLPGWLQVHALSPPASQRASTWTQSGLLHTGEAEALSLALHLKSDWFITDDAAARLTGESMGLECRGSLGIILWTRAQKLISNERAERYLQGLENSSLCLSQKVRVEARKVLAKLQ